MDDQTDERIRMRAFELSLDPSRAGMSAFDNWLAAERSIRGGLQESAVRYETDDLQASAAENTVEPARATKAAGPRNRRRAS